MLKGGIGLALCLGLMGGTHPVEPSFIPASAAIPALRGPDDIVGEITGLRDAYSKHYLLKDGQHLARIGSAPLHYRDAEGRWRDIDLSLKREGGALYNDSAPLQVFLPKDIREGVVFRRDGEEGLGFDFIPEGLRGERGGRFPVSGLARPEQSPSPMGISRVLYRGAAPSADARFDVQNWGVKHDLLLQAPLPGAGPGSDLVYAWRMKIHDGLSLVWDSEGEENGKYLARNLRLVDGNAKPVIFIGAPLVHEEGGAPDGGASVIGRYRVEVLDEFNLVYRVEMAVDGAWLSAPERRYPVALDPSISVAGGWGGWQYWDGAAGSYVEGNPTTVVFTATSYNSREYRAYVKFDLTSVSGARILTDAALSFTQNLNSLADNRNIDVYDVSNEPPFGAFSTTYFNDLGLGTRYGHFDADPINDLKTMIVDNRQALLNNVQKGILNPNYTAPWFAVGLRMTNGGAGMYARYTSNLSYLDLVYQSANANPRNVVIDEVDIGSPDSIVLYNYGSDVTMTNWTMVFHDDIAGPPQTFTFPTFTLRHHNFVRIRENTGGNDDYTLYTGFNISFDRSRDGQLELKDSTGIGQDYFEFNTYGNSGAYLPGGVHFRYGVSTNDTFLTYNIFHRITDFRTGYGAYDFDLTNTLTPLVPNMPQQAGTKLPSGVVINEVQTNSAYGRWVELYNYGPRIVIGGWVLTIWSSDVFRGNYVFPENYSLDHGATVRVMSGSGSDTADTLYSGFTFGFTTGGSGEVWLEGPIGVDYVRFRNPASPSAPPAGTSWLDASSVQGSGDLISRVSDIDTDFVSDWTVRTYTSSSINAVNPGQMAEPPLYENLGSAQTTASPGSGQRGRGNAFLVSETFTAHEIRQRLNLAAAQDINFVIFEQVGASWTQVFSKTVTSVGPGLSTYSSGPMKFVFEAGKRYAVIPYWSGTANNYYYTSVTGSTPNRQQFMRYAAWNYLVSENGPPAGAFTTSTASAVFQEFTVLPGTTPDLEITTSSMPIGYQNQNYSETLEAYALYPPLTWAKTAGTLPTGASVSSAGLVSATPLGSSGSYSFTASVTDAIGNTATRVIPWAVYPDYNNSVQIMTSALPDGILGQVYPSVQLSAKSQRVLSWINVSGAPPGLSLSGKGVISGTPTVIGNYSWTVRVDDGAGHIDQKTFPLSVRSLKNPDYWVRKGLTGGQMTAAAISGTFQQDGTMFAVALQKKLYKTGDGGKQWAELTAPADDGTPWISDVAVSPNYANDQTAFFGSNEDGVYRSTNGGASWQKVLQKFYPFMEFSAPTAVEFSPDYANDQTVFAHVDNTIYRSRDGGSTWDDINPGGNSSFAVAPGWNYQPVLFAVDDGTDGEGNLYRSDNCGDSWIEIYTGSCQQSLDEPCFGHVYASPNFLFDSVLFAESAKGGNGAPYYWKSKDGGFTWSNVYEGGTYGDAYQTFVPPTYDDTTAMPSRNTIFITPYWATGVDPLLRSQNGGRTFERFNAQSFGSAQVSALLFSPDFASDGTMFLFGPGVWVSRDGGASFFKSDQGILAVGINDVAVSPNFPTDKTVYAATDVYGLVVSTDKGQTWAPLAVQPGFDVTKIALSPTYSKSAGSGVNATIFATAAVSDISSTLEVFWSSNHGASWSNIWANGSPSQSGRYASCIAVAPNYSSTGRIFVGTNFYGIQTKTGFSATPTWSQYDSAVDLLGYDWLYDVKVSPNYATDQCVWGSYYVSGGGGRIYKSTNDGPAWTLMQTVTGRPSFVSLSPTYNDDSGAGYAGYVWAHNQRSTSRGSSWTPFPYSGPGDGYSTVRVSPSYTSDAHVFLGERNSYTAPSGVGLFAVNNSKTQFDSVAQLAGRNVTCIGYSPAYNKNGPDATVFVGTNDGGLFISRTVTPNFVPSDASSTLPDNITGVAAKVTNENTLYATSLDQGVFRSLDKGETFGPFNMDLVPGQTVNRFNDVDMAPSNDRPAIATDMGVYYDSGTNWTRSNLTLDTNKLARAKDDAGNFYLWASTNSGVFKDISGIGSTWVQKDNSVFRNVSGHVINTTGGGFERPGGPKAGAGLSGDRRPDAAKSVMWGGTAAGVESSPDGGENWYLTNGGTCALADTDVYAVLALSSGTVLAGTKSGVYRSTDGGDCWLPANGGLEATTLDVSSFYESCYGDNGLKDALVGIIGAADGGVYLSADDGEHWAVLNEGFDPDELQVQELVSDSASVCSEVTYYSGKQEDGLWARTITPNAAPTISSLSKSSGAPEGGTALSLTGTGFRQGAVAEFGGAPATGVVLSNCTPDAEGEDVCTTLSCSTPAGVAGTQVEVRVRNADTRTGYSGTDFTYIKADFTHDAPKCAGTAVNFDSSGSVGASSYAWLFGDGIGTSTLPNPSYAYSSGGNYTVRLTITDVYGDTNYTEQIISINANPTASVAPAGPITFCNGGSQLLTVTPSGGAGGYTYQWQNGGVNIGGATASTYTATATGTYRCVVTDSACGTVNSNTVTVTANANPDASFTHDGPVCLGTVMNFSAAVTGQGTYEWDFTYNGVTFNVAKTGENVSKTYATSGNKTAALRVTTPEGCQSIVSQSVSVLDPPQPIDNTFTLALGGGGAQMHFAWTNTPGATFYRVYSSASPQGPFTTEVASGADGAAGVSVPMPAGNLCFFKVVAENAACDDGTR